MEHFKYNFWKSVDKQGKNDCWNWLGKRSAQGCPTLKVGLNIHFANNIFVLLTTGRAIISEGYVYHTCGNELCFNPSHIKIRNTNSVRKELYIKPKKLKMYKLSVDVSGENHSQAKLTNKKVNAIRKIYKLGNITQRELAKLYEVSQSTIKRVINNIHWRCIGCSVRNLQQLSIN